MKTIKKLFVIAITLLCFGLVFSNTSYVEAKSNSAITGVSASKKGKKITVKFKKKSGAKRYKLRYYTVSKKGVKSKKAITKIVKATKCKKLSGNKLSYSFNVGKTQNVVIDITYSKKNSGNKFNKTYSDDTCSKHKWLTKTKNEKVEDTSNIIGYEQKVKSTENEWKCDGCGVTGTKSELSIHMNNYKSKFTECQQEVFEYVAKKYNVTTDVVYNAISSVNTNIGQDETADKYMKACLEWMNKNTEFKCYYGDDAYVFGCIEDTTTGKTITTYEDDLTKPIYGEKEVTTTYKECKHCKNTKKVKSE